MMNKTYLNRCLVLMFLLLAFCFNSCSEQNREMNEVVVVAEDTRQLFEQITTTESRDKQIERYSDLTTQEKLELWQYKFSRLDVSAYTKEQLALIKEVKSYLNLQFFTSRNKEAVGEDWLARAQRHFNKEEIQNLVLSLSVNNLVVLGVKCNCSNDLECLGWCLQLAQCKDTDGCGFLWLSKCTGLC